MVQETPRAARYRQRADAIDTAAKNLSDADRATALRHQQALRHLADMEDWVSAEPHVAAKHDYMLEPKNDTRPRGPVRANAPGRRVTKPAGVSEAAAMLPGVSAPKAAPEQ